MFRTQIRIARCMWGSLLGTSNTAADVVKDESQVEAVLTFNRIVSAAYLDMNVRSIVYEISLLNYGEETSSPGASYQFGK